MSKEHRNQAEGTPMVKTGATADRPMKRCSASLVTGEMKLKVTVNCHLTAVSMANIKKT